MSASELDHEHARSCATWEGTAMKDQEFNASNAIAAPVTRRQTIRTAAAIGLGALATPSYIGRAWAAKTIRIGFVSPETGPIAAFGSADEFVVGEIRKAIGDGLTIGGT